MTQRRLAISRLRVPNLDGFVDTAAGDLLSIWTPRHRKDIEIVRSQDTNQQKQRGKHLRNQDLGLAIWRLPVDPERALGEVISSSIFVKILFDTASRR